jgi:hypothetical protein
VFIDTFLGGGSVSLDARARGYRVLANDIAERSHIVGKALIENDRTKLSKKALLRLFATNGSGPGFVERRYCPDVFTTKNARFLDRALASGPEVEGTTRWLLLLLVVKCMFRMRPMGTFGAKTIVHQMQEGRWEGMNPHYVRDALTRRITGHPRTNVEAIRRQINRGVFSNAKANRVWRLDVFEFLLQVEGAEHGGLFLEGVRARPPPSPPRRAAREDIPLEIAQAAYRTDGTTTVALERSGLFDVSIDRPAREVPGKIAAGRNLRAVNEALGAARDLVFMSDGPTPLLAGGAGAGSAGGFERFLNELEHQGR